MMASPSYSVSLDPRHQLTLADKADIDARRKETFQSVELPELDEYLGAEIKTCSGVGTERLEADETLQRIEGDGDDSDSEEEPEADTHVSRIEGDNCSEEEESVFSEKSAEVEKACSVALETVFEAKDAKLGTDSTDELMEFVMETFDSLHQSKREQLKESIKLNSSKKSQLTLMCKVVRGSGLIAQDPNGKSDPYCRVGLLSETHLNSEIVKHKDLLDWDDARMMGRGQLRSTHVVPETLEPEWNETIEMPIGDVSDEYLVLEVWDDDEYTRSIKGVKGFVTYMAEKTTKKGDDFMGRLFHPLRSIPMFLSSGEEKTFDLVPHPGRSQRIRGTITLQLSIKVQKESLPVQIAVRYYNVLARSLVNSCTKRDGRYQRNWDGQLPPNAEKLLKYNALLNNIHEAQMAYTWLDRFVYSCLFLFKSQMAVSLSVSINDVFASTCTLKARKLSLLLSYHKMYRVELSAFCSEIERIRALPHQQSPPYFSPKQELVLHLFNGFEKQTSSCIDAIMRHTDAKRCKRFKQKIKIFHQLYSFGPFIERLPAGSRSCDELLERCTLIVVAKWFLEQYAELFMQSGKEKKLEEKSGGGFNILTEQCAYQLEKGLRLLHPCFSEVGIDFFSHFYVAFDKLIGAEGETRVCMRKDASLYPVYLQFRKMDKLSQNVDQSHMEKGLCLLKSLSWFERCNTVPQWIQVAIEKCKTCIKNSVADDEPIPVTSCVKFSRSAFHTEGFLRKLGSFWKNLEWPEPLMSSCYAVMIVNGIAECSGYYVSECGKRLGCIEEHFDEKKVSQKLCIFLNNVNHICSTVSECSEWLNLDPLYDWLDEKQKIGEKCRSVVEKIIQENHEAMCNCIITSEIAKILVPNIQQLLQEMVQGKKSANSDQSDTTATVFCAPLLDYLTGYLTTFTSCLDPPVASGILLYLWEASVDSVEKCADEIPRRKGRDSTHLYYKLFMALSMLREFFYCGGRGIQKEQLDTKKFEKLHSRLYILSKPTEDLVSQYLSDLAQLQPRDDDGGGEGEEEETFGMLHFSVAYLKDRSTLEVDIIQAVDLPALDRDGSSDPYVKVSLMPSWIFRNASKKTKVYKNTTKPLIDEEMNLQASEEKLNSENTMLLFTVFDWDLMKEDDFAGMCIVPCKDIPRLQGTDAGQQRAMILEADAPQRKVFRLSLFHPPGKAASPIRAELESRAKLNDSKAKQVIEVVPLPNPR